jgi:hypothetical protein
VLSHEPGLEFVRPQHIAAHLAGQAEWQVAQLIEALDLLAVLVDERLACVARGKEMLTAFIWMAFLLAAVGAGIAARALF